MKTVNYRELVTNGLHHYNKLVWDRTAYPSQYSYGVFCVMQEMMRKQFRDRLKLLYHPAMPSSDFVVHWSEPLSRWVRDEVRVRTLPPWVRDFYTESGGVMGDDDDTELLIGVGRRGTVLFGSF